MPEASSGEDPKVPGAGRSWLRRARSRRVIVHDASMAPTLEPGDRLLVDAGVYRHRLPLVGEIVVFVDPLEPTRWLVKRVAGVGPIRMWRTLEGVVSTEDTTGAMGWKPPETVETIEVPASFVYVTGDAADASRDSRRFGAVPVRDLVGRVYRCYAPPERRREF
jgi:signal peptidase I